MKKLLFTLLVIMITSVSLIAQEKGFTASVGAGGSMYGNSGFKPVNLNIDLGYFVGEKFFVVTKVEATIGLFEINDVKNHFINETIGGGVGYNLLISDAGVLDFRVACGSTLRKQDWQYVYYDGGLYFNIGKSKTKPTLGFGYRYYNSSNNKYGNYSKIYFSLGFKFN